MLINPDNYKDNREPLLDDINGINPKLFDILNQKGFALGTLHRLAPIMYIADKTKQKYIFFYGSCKQMLGYDSTFLANAGPDFFINLLHHNDFRIFQEKITPEVTTFLKTQHERDYSNFSFSLNYRIKKNDGNYLNMLQRVMFFALAGESIPLVEVGLITDVTHYMEDSRMIHIIERAEDNLDIFSSVELFKSVYFPDRLGNVLSNREREILKGISEGLSSKEIANKLFISINTIHNHRKNMLQKTHTNNSAELLKYALSNYLL